MQHGLPACVLSCHRAEFSKFPPFFRDALKIKGFNPEFVYNLSAQTSDLPATIIVSRKKKGGNNGKKAKRRVARIHARVANCRREHQHKVSNDLISRYGKIAIESFVFTDANVALFSIGTKTPLGIFSSVLGLERASGA